MRCDGGSIKLSGFPHLRSNVLRPQRLVVRKYVSLVIRMNKHLSLGANDKHYYRVKIEMLHRLL